MTYVMIFISIKGKTGSSFILMLHYVRCVTLIVAYLPGPKPSDAGTIHRGLLNVIEKAYTDESLRAALLQLTQPGCRCSEAQSCLVRSPLSRIRTIVLSDYCIRR